MQRCRMLAWAVVLPLLCLPGPWPAQPAHGQAPAAITFTLRNNSRSSEWPVAVRRMTIAGRTVPFDRPVRLEGNWMQTAVITLVNVSPKTIVRTGMDITFPESGDGSSDHPYLGWQAAKGRVPKIVYLGRDGYHLPPRWDRDAPLQLVPGGVLQVSFAGRNDSIQKWLGGRGAVQAMLTFETVFFADGSRWSAGEYALAPVPPSRSWTMVSKEEFVRSARR
ncbi:MAG TPA: hypothetical protein VL990_10305 [Acidobacteriaceae bacterium]|nr:hypothetical protein [Acidobacteriaceae bacterium]